MPFHWACQHWLVVQVSMMISWYQIGNSVIIIARQLNIFVTSRNLNGLACHCTIISDWMCALYSVRTHLVVSCVYSRLLLFNQYLITFNMPLHNLQISYFKNCNSCDSRPNGSAKENSPLLPPLHDNMYVTMRFRVQFLSENLKRLSFDWPTKPVDHWSVQCKCLTEHLWNKHPT